MAFFRAQIVRSVAGRDKGKAFCILDTDGPYLLLADGKCRKAARPKRKKAIHAERAGEFGHPVLEKLLQGKEVTDSEIRRALAAFRAESRRI